MSRTVLVFFAIIAFSLSGCAKSAWPSEVQVGKTVQFTLVGSDTSGQGKVTRIEGDWLTLEYKDGRPLQIPREKVTFLRVMD